MSSISLSRKASLRKNSLIRKFSKNQEIVHEFARTIWLHDAERTLRHILQFEFVQKTLSTFLKTEYAEETLEFYLDVGRISKLSVPERDLEALKVCQLLGQSNDGKNIGVDGAFRKIQTQAESTLRMIAMDAFPRFLKSPFSSKLMSGFEIQNRSTGLKIATQLNSVETYSPIDSDEWLAPLISVADTFSCGLTMADMTISGAPLIYVNKEFENMTGYTLAEVTGRNCRFLQGPETEGAAVIIMRDALSKGQDCHVKVTNYRRTGETFQNSIHMKPVYDTEGVYRFVIAIQFDQTDFEGDARTHLAFMDKLLRLLPKKIDVKSNGINKRISMDAHDDNNAEVKHTPMRRLPSKKSMTGKIKKADSKLSLKSELSSNKLVTESSIANFYKDIEMDLSKSDDRKIEKKESFRSRSPPPPSNDDYGDIQAVEEQGDDDEEDAQGSPNATKEKDGTQGHGRRRSNSVSRSANQLLTSAESFRKQSGGISSKSSSKIEKEQQPRKSSVSTWEGSRPNSPARDLAPPSYKFRAPSGVTPVASTSSLNPPGAAAPISPPKFAMSPFGRQAAASNQEAQAEETEGTGADTEQQEMVEPSGTSNGQNTNHVGIRNYLMQPRQPTVPRSLQPNLSFLSSASATGPAKFHLPVSSSAASLPQPVNPSGFSKFVLPSRAKNAAPISRLQLNTNGNEMNTGNVRENVDNFKDIDSSGDEIREGMPVNANGAAPTDYQEELYVPDQAQKEWQPTPIFELPHCLLRATPLTEQPMKYIPEYFSIQPTPSYSPYQSRAASLLQSNVDDGFPLEADNRSNDNHNHHVVAEYTTKQSPSPKQFKLPEIHRSPNKKITSAIGLSITNNHNNNKGDGDGDGDGDNRELSNQDMSSDIDSPRLHHALIGKDVLFRGILLRL